MRFVFLRFPNSLVGNILLTSAGASLFVVALAGAVLAVVLSWQEGPYLWEGLDSDVRGIEAGMRFDSAGNLVRLVLSADLDQQYDSLEKDLAFRVLDERGDERLSSAAGPALLALRAWGSKPIQSAAIVSSQGTRLRIWGKSVGSGDHKYVIYVARSQRLATTLRAGGQRLVVTMGFVTTLVVVLIFSYFVHWSARRVAQRLREVSEAAAAVKPENLTQRLDGSQLPSELMPLIDAFNRALERLENGYRVQQAFLASAAHELKTPLALIRGEIEMESSPNREAILMDVDLMARHVQQLLQLAEVSDRQNYTFEVVDLIRVLEDVVDYASRLAISKKIKIDMVCRVDQMELIADRGSIFTLGKNLVENAIHHSPDGDVIVVGVGNNGFFIRDRGQGVNEKDVPKLFTRFWRSADAPYVGTGLGLSICKEIAAAHRWGVYYRSVSNGQGAEFHVSLHRFP